MVSAGLVSGVIHVRAMSGRPCEAGWSAPSPPYAVLVTSVTGLAQLHPVLAVPLGGRTAAAESVSMNAIVSAPSNSGVCSASRTSTRRYLGFSRCALP